MEFLSAIHLFIHGGLISRGIRIAALDVSAAQDWNMGNRTWEASDKNEQVISATRIGKKDRKWGKISSVLTNINNVSEIAFGLVSDEFKPS